MAKSDDLLGTSIHKIQAVWMGLDELRQANYALRSLPKALKFLCAVPPSESLKVIRLVGNTQPGHPLLLQWLDPLPLVWEGGPEQGDNG